MRSSVSTLGSLEAIESLRPLWKAICRHCDADIDFIQQIVSKRPGFLRPHVLASSVPGAAQTLLAGRVERRPWRFWLRHPTGSRSPVSALVIPSGGFMGDETSATCNPLVTEIWQALRRGEFDLALFGGVERGSPLYKAVLSTPPFWCREHGVKHEVHWRGHLSASLDEFLQRISSRHRKLFRHHQRDLEAAFPGKIQFRNFTQPGDVEELAAATDEVARQTYQYRRGGSFRSSEGEKSFLELAARQGWLRGYVLYIGPRPIAFWIGILYKGSCRLDTTGYLQEYKQFDPGVVLFLHMINDLCRQGVRELDFGTGDSIFKTRFGDFKSEMATVCMFAPTCKGITLMAAKCVRSMMESCSRRIAMNVGAEQSLRRIWRTLPAAWRLKQSLIILLSYLGILITGIWQEWFQWPVAIALTVVLCVLASLEIVRRLVARPPPPR